MQAQFPELPKTMQSQITSIHRDEVLAAKNKTEGTAYVHVFLDKIGYGESSLAAIRDSGFGSEVSDNSSFKSFSTDFNFVSQCYDEDYEKMGILFKF